MGGDMPNGFQRISYSVHDRKDDELQAIGTSSIARRGIGRARHEDEGVKSFLSDEAAARFYLSKVLVQDKRSGLRGLTSPERAEVMPEMRVQRTQQVPSSSDRIVTFQQTSSEIPIFGSSVAVQLDHDRELVNVGGDLAIIDRIPSVAALSPTEALEKVAGFGGVSSKT